MRFHTAILLFAAAIAAGWLIAVLHHQGAQVFGLMNKLQEIRSTHTATGTRT